MSCDINAVLFDDVYAWVESPEVGSSAEMGVEE